VVVTILYAIWAGVFDTTSTAGLMTLFTLSQFFLNLGPNATTFLLPVEVFPTRVRGTAHGIAAASGKAGAVITAFAFGTITDHIGVKGVLGLFSGIMALCSAVTLLIPEPKGKTIDEIERGVLYGESIASSDESLSSGQLETGSDETKISATEKVREREVV
jgi:PHS family inorganic phosphate transporter-like MFS transporter